jgi:hypothetical protein
MNELELVGFRAVVKGLLAANKRDKSWEILEHFFAKARSLAEFDTIGQLCLDTEHRELHLQCAERSYAVAYTSQQRYAARTNLIKAYNTMNEPEKALSLINIQLQINPNNYEMLCEKAANIALMGNRDTAELIINKLAETNPDHIINLQAMLSGKYLREGQLAKGVRGFVEGYKENNKVFDEQLKMKRWDGIPRPGKTLYVYGEGGVGDEIINIRFFKQIDKLGMQPILVTVENEWHSDKNNLLRRHGVEILCETHSIDRTQYWTPMMSLPADLNLTEEDLWKGTYLKPLRQEKNRLKGDKFKIGIKCSGNPFFAQDEYRKIPLELMLSYLPKDADIYYIDKTKGYPGTIELADRIESWEDTLDFIDQMDCIVSSCTSLVHAAGAIGKTTFVAVPIAEYYIWTSSRTDESCPWYGDNFHVLKQTQWRDWTQPLSKISKQVKTLMDGNLRPVVSDAKEKNELDTTKYNVFVVTSTINTNIGVIDSNIRYLQTLDTIKSIRKKVPNSFIILIDNSSLPLTNQQEEKLSQNVDKFLLIGDRKPCIEFNKIGFRSAGECYMLLEAIGTIKKLKLDVDRIFKLTARYKLSDKFNVDEYIDIKEKYCFRPLQETDNYSYHTRLWSFCYSIINDCEDMLRKSLVTITRDMINIEEAIFKNIDTNLVINKSIIHIEGALALTGEYIKE